MIAAILCAVAFAAAVGAAAYFTGMALELRRAQAHERSQHEWLLGVMREGHSAEIIRLQSAITSGYAEVQAARTLRPPPSPDDRLADMVDLSTPRAFSEETMQRGIESLQKEYREAGMDLTVEEARMQVLAMMSGVAPGAETTPWP
jgi:hypothetical protein